jgi:DNA-binding transcriptional regulator YiaG
MTVDPDELKRHRKMLGLKQTELAEKLGVHAITLSRWERGFVKVPSPVAVAVKLLVAEARAIRRTQ